MAGDAFQKFKSSVNRGITTISVKTSSSLEKSKIKTHIDSLKREIEKELMLVGETAYQVWESNTNDYSVLNERFESIQNKRREINELNLQLSSIDERDQQILGNKTEEQPVDSTPKYFCSKCGAQYEVPAKFCRKCGNKMEE